MTVTRGTSAHWHYTKARVCVAAERDLLRQLGRCTSSTAEQLEC